MRQATSDDVDFLSARDREADLEDAQGDAICSEDLSSHRQRIAQIVEHHLAWLVPGEGFVLGLWCAKGEGASGHLPELDALLPAGSRYAEVFQLWVRPGARRQGIGRALKQRLEEDARQRGCALVYTHTRARNAHVLALNASLGYEELRRGPLWDEVPRVSLIKQLSRRSPLGR